MAESKHQAVKEYLEPKVYELAGKLNFNFSPESPDSFAIVTEYSGKVVKSYINGDYLKEYAFAVVIVKTYSTENDDLNIEAMDFAQGFMDWLDEQNRNKEFPEFDGCEVVSIENLQNMPNLAAVNPEEGLARYQIQGRIRYLEKHSFGKETL